MPLYFRGLEYVPINSKELSLPVKQVNIKLKNQNIPIREKAKALTVAIWYILKKKECKAELTNTK